jgi:hypothetical protein
MYEVTGNVYCSLNTHPSYHKLDPFFCWHYSAQCTSLQRNVISIQNFAAENLLKGDSFKKWKGASAGSKQESVTLQVGVKLSVHVHHLSYLSINFSLTRLKKFTSWTLGMNHQRSLRFLLVDPLLKMMIIRFDLWSFFSALTLMWFFIKGSPHCIIFYESTGE